MSVKREGVCAKKLARLLINNVTCRNELAVFRLDDDTVFKTCSLIDLNLKCRALDNTFKLGNTVKLSNDNRVEWVPVCDYRT